MTGLINFAPPSPKAYVPTRAIDVGAAGESQKAGEMNGPGKA